MASCIVVGGFVALWLTANELEDPFGYDANDIPMVRYHVDFCAALDSSISRPWMAKDRWDVASGVRRPSSPSLAVGRAGARPGTIEE